MVSFYGLPAAATGVVAIVAIASCPSSSFDLPPWVMTSLVHTDIAQPGCERRHRFRGSGGLNSCVRTMASTSPFKLRRPVLFPENRMGLVVRGKLASR